jgi:protein-S-isoprenylcysteine O-methyltransferase Ste14
MHKTKLLPPVTFFGALLVMVGLYAGLPVVKIIPSPWNSIGVIFLLAGFVFLLSSDPAAGSAENLITDGVFGLSRNPLYLGFALLLTGMAVLMGALTPFAVIPAYLFLVYRLIIRKEEQLLTAKFGLDYLEYELEVPRWF